jgi:hypothetical protein
VELLKAACAISTLATVLLMIWQVSGLDPYVVRTTLQYLKSTSGVIDYVCTSESWCVFSKTRR